MTLSPHATVRAARRFFGALLATCALLPAPALALINYNWAAAASGSAADPARWSPFGVPNWDDHAHYVISGTYTVTYPAGTPSTQMVNFVAGNVTFNLDSPHTTKEFLVGAGSGAPTLTLAYGRMNTDYVNLGYPGSLTRLTLTGSSLGGSSTLATQSRGNRYYSGSGGDIIGYGGITYLDVFGGAWYICDRSHASAWPLQVGKESGAATTISVAGRNAMLFQNSTLRVIGGDESTVAMIVGVAGSANVFAYNYGRIDVAGTMMIAQLAGSSAWVNIGPNTGLGTGSLLVHRHLWIGNNFYDSVAAGHGEVIVRGNGNIARVLGECRIGDPDNDAGSLLRVGPGATVRIGEGLRVFPTTGPGLDLRGGLTHVRGGAFVWPAGKFLTISSQVGTPELAISSGVVSTGPSTPAFNAQLFVGRAGTGTLRVTQPGTVFAMGLGATSLADSVGGVGTVVVDSLAAFTSGGPVNLAVRGYAELQVLGGSLVDVGTLAAGVVTGATGQAAVSGPGSRLVVRDNLWLGGGFGGPGGTGSLEIDQGALVEVLHTGGVNPAATNIYENGTLIAATGGRLETSGYVWNRNLLGLRGGAVAADFVTLVPTGHLDGWGDLEADLNNSGRIDPHGDGVAFGTIEVDGGLTLLAQSRYRADLGQPAGQQYDRLVIAGHAALDGTLELRSGPGFLGDPGDAYAILACASRSGTFADVTWNGAPLDGEVEIVYAPSGVTVVVPGGTTAVEPGGSAIARVSFAPSRVGGLLQFALALPEAAVVEARVFDVRGREVGLLARGALPAGMHHLEPLTGSRDLPSGVYFARAVVRAGARTETLAARTVLVR